MDEMFESGELVVTETARVVARNVVSLPVWWVIRPLLWLFNLPGIGSLPTAIRQAYGFRWVWWHQASLRFSALLLRTLLRFVPSIFATGRKLLDSGLPSWLGSKRDRR